MKVLLFKHITDSYYDLVEAETDSMNTARAKSISMMKKETKDRAPLFTQMWFLVADEQGEWLDDSE